MKNLIYSSLAVVLLLGTSACSMKDRTEVHSVSVALPKAWASSSSSTMNILNHSSSLMDISYPSPSSLNSFQCYALNVSGPGIQSDPRMGCTDPNSGLGLIGGFVPITSGSIDMMVPAGAARKITLIGVQSSVGCPLFNDLLNAGGPDALHNMGQPYILGTTTTDIFDDAAVTIHAAFDPNQSAFNGCGDHHGGGNNAQELRMQVMNNSPAIQTNHCSQFGIFGSGTGPFPAAAPTLLSQPATGTATLYSDSSCATPVTGYYSANGNAYPNFYIKLSAAATGTFDAQVNTTATGWTAPTVTYAAVSDRLSVSVANSNSPLNTCQMITISSVDYMGSQGLAANLGSITLQVHNRDNSNNVLPQVEVYLNGSLCSTQTGALTATSSSQNSSSFSIGTIGATSTSIYVRNSVGESDDLQITRTTNTAEPAGGQISFVPFTIPSLTGNTGGAGGTISIPFSGGTGTVPTGITLGSSANCPITAQNGAGISCTVPSVLPGQYPLYVSVGATSYYSGYNYTVFPSVTTFAGSTSALSGTSDGTGTAARFTAASGIAYDSGTGNYYVADSNNQVIRKITSAGVVTTIAGTVGSYGLNDATGTSASFYMPTGLALSGSNLYIADMNNNKIRKLDLTNMAVTTVAGTGSVGSANYPSLATFSAPTGVAVDGSGNIYVADSGNNMIRKIDVSNSNHVSTYAGTGTTGDTNGGTAIALFRSPWAIAFDPGMQNLFVTEVGGHRVRKINIANSQVSTYAGPTGTPTNGSGNGPAASASFYSPKGVAVDALGNVYVGDTSNSLIRMIDTMGNVSNFAGVNGNSGHVDGPGSTASFLMPTAMVLGSSGSLVVTDMGNNSIRKLSW